MGGAETAMDAWFCEAAQEQNLMRHEVTLDDIIASQKQLFGAEPTEVRAKPVRSKMRNDAVDRKRHSSGSRSMGRQNESDDDFSTWEGSYEEGDFRSWPEQSGAAHAPFSPRGLGGLDIDGVGRTSSLSVTAVEAKARMRYWETIYEESEKRADPRRPRGRQRRAPKKYSGCLLEGGPYSRSGRAAFSVFNNSQDDCPPSDRVQYVVRHLTGAASKCKAAVQKPTNPGTPSPKNISPKHWIDIENGDEELLTTGMKCTMPPPPVSAAILKKAVAPGEGVVEVISDSE